MSNEVIGASHEDDRLRALVRRSLKHSDMREALRGFASGNLKSIYKDVVGEYSDAGLKTVADSYITLQQDGNKADYDLSWRFTLNNAEVSIIDSERAVNLLDVALADGGNSTFKKLFLVSMLFHGTLKARE